MTVKASIARMKKRIAAMGAAPSARTAALPLADFTPEERAFVVKAIELLGLDDEQAELRAMSDAELARRIAEAEARSATELDVAAADAALEAAGLSLRSTDLLAARDLLRQAGVRF